LIFDRPFLIFEMADSPPNNSTLRERVHATNATKSSTLRPLRERVSRYERKE